MSINLLNVIDAFLDERKLDFIVERGKEADNLHPGVIYPIGSSRCRGVVWAEHVEIYDINPTRTYTAMGDLRCNLEASDPNFFEDLERHLLVDDAGDVMLSISGT